MNKQVLIFGASGGLGYELLKIFVSKIIKSSQQDQTK